MLWHSVWPDPWPWTSPPPSPVYPVARCLASAFQLLACFRKIGFTAFGGFPVGIAACLASSTNNLAYRHLIDRSFLCHRHCPDACGVRIHSHSARRRSGFPWEHRHLTAQRPFTKLWVLASSEPAVIAHSVMNLSMSEGSCISAA